MANSLHGPRGPQLVIGITGRIGSGKTTVGRYLESRHGFQYLRYSAVLADWLAKDPESKAHLQEVGWEVMAGGMQAELNRRLIGQIEPSSDVAVDGLRHPLDSETLKSAFASFFHLLYIDSPPSVRFDRLSKKRKYGNLASFNATDSHAVEQHIESLRARAELVIPNVSSLDALYTSIDEAIFNFRREG